VGLRAGVQFRTASEPRPWGEVDRWQLSYSGFDRVFASKQEISMRYPNANANMPEHAYDDIPASKQPSAASHAVTPADMPKHVNDGDAPAPGTAK